MGAFIKNIFYDKIDLRLFYFHVTKRLLSGFHHAPSQPDQNVVNNLDKLLDVYCWFC